MMITKKKQLTHQISLSHFLKKISQTHTMSHFQLYCNHNSSPISLCDFINSRFKVSEVKTIFFQLNHATKLNSVKPNDLIEFYTIYVTWLSLLLRRLDLFFRTKVYYLRI